jgi:hypothetical protein
MDLEFPLEFQEFAPVSLPHGYQIIPIRAELQRGNRIAQADQNEQELSIPKPPRMAKNSLRQEMQQAPCSVFAQWLQVSMMGLCR